MPKMPDLESSLALLEIEKKEDFVQYQSMVLRRSLKERCQNGVSRYPVHLKRVNIGTGEKIVLEIQSESNQPKSTVLQPGSMVSVFGMEVDKEVGRVGGVLALMQRESMRIVLSTENIPDWLYSAKIGVDLAFDDSTYKEMDKAVRAVIQAKKEDRITQLRSIMLSEKPARFHKWDYTYHNPGLNPSQNKAVQMVLEALDIAVIHGPPGTGKTTTLVQAIKETLHREHQVLVCAPSNTAVDLLVLRCHAEGMNTLRIGNPARVDATLQQHTLDGMIAAHDDYKALRKLRRDAEDMRKRALKYKRKYGSIEYHKRNALLKEAGELHNLAHKLEDYIVHQILSQAQVIACTLSGAGSSILGSKRFHTVFIDEASQALTPACWIPLLRSDRVIFAGDHCQLPPTIKSIEAEKGGLGVTLMEAIITQKPEVSVMLEQQYRMHEHIMRFSSQEFYADKVFADPSVRYRTLGEGFPPVELLDTSGCGFHEGKDPDTLSTFNLEEAQLMLKHLAMLINQLENASPEIFSALFTIGIIAPYKAQVAKILDLIHGSPMLSAYMAHISVNTVDGFQGQERDVIYISLTRSNLKGEIGFLGDKRRMNVALTRARKKLVVVGDGATLVQNPFFERLFNYAESIDAYRTAWELSGIE